MIKVQVNPKSHLKPSPKPEDKSRGVKLPEKDLLAKKMPFIAEVLAMPFSILRILLLMVSYILHNLIVKRIVGFRLWPDSIKVDLLAKVNKIYGRYTEIVDHTDNGSLSMSAVMDLAVSNLRVKKSRSIVTVGGVAIGIGAVVFLVSIGYGFQDLVIGKVARLEELSQVNVSSRVSSINRLDDKLSSEIAEYPGVKSVLPQISVVGKISYNNSVSSVAVFGVTTKYLTESAVKTTSGVVFNSNNKTVSAEEQDNFEKALAEQNSKKTPDVLSETITATDFIELPGEGTETAKIETVKLPFSKSAVKEAMLNTAVLQVMGVDAEQIIGKEIDITYEIPNTLLEDKIKKYQSNDTKYRVVGVIEDNANPYIYVPYIDLKGLGITKNSQLKIVLSDQNQLADIRTKIESLGLTTTSVADTVKQVQSLFNSVTLGLAFMGMFALSVASLGMFNTFTVSLLERTREIGLMKAIGMRSSEVKKLFLTESLFMALSGGVVGLALGFILGQILNLIVSYLSISKGLGALSVTYIPAIVVWAIMGLSFLVGVFTGFYPAQRATKISPLNALRYE